METCLPKVALEYQPARKSQKPIWPLLVRLGAAVGGVALAIFLVLPTMCGAREPANRVKCASNMKQIGLAAIMYANDHGGRFPDDLDAILTSEDLAPVVMTCPTTADTPATGDTPRAMLEDFHKPGHVSYVYVGKGLTVKSPSDAVVLYEPLSNHTNDGMKVWSERLADRSGDGMNVLFADGHVEWLGNEEGRSILSQAEAGVRPIRFPAEKDK
jgi:prepilin-type processing-associated H-X9-DG protein